MQYSSFEFHTLNIFSWRNKSILVVLLSVGSNNNIIADFNIFIKPKMIAKLNCRCSPLLYNMNLGQKTIVWSFYFSYHSKEENLHTLWLSVHTFGHYYVFISRSHNNSVASFLIGKCWFTRITITDCCFIQN